jgi:anti-anti-sigma factor
MQDINALEQPGSPDQPDVELRWPRSGVAQIVLFGEHDLANSAALERTIELTLDGRPTQLLIDLTVAEFIDSTVIRTLVLACRGAEKADIGFNLIVAPDTIVRRALEVTNVLAALNAVESLDAALQPDRGSHNGSTRMTPTIARAQGGGSAST